MTILRIATRQSVLALHQANCVKECIEQHYPSWQVQVVGLTTEGDTRRDESLADIGGKGLFTKNLENALLAGEADLAVHSMKDVPPCLDEAFVIAAVLPREDARDVLVSVRGECFSKLPHGATVGTCSVRRQAQLLHHRPDLKVQPLRGNVDTRLAKLDAREFDAIVLASAGLHRLQRQSRITEYFSTDFLLPSVAQGAIGVECLQENHKLVQQLQRINHAPSAQCIRMERALVRALKGDCHSPIGSYAEREGNGITLRGLVASRDGSCVIRADAKGLFTAADTWVKEVQDKLLEQGAEELLAWR